MTEGIPSPFPSHISADSIKFTQYLMPDGRQKTIYWKPTTPYQATLAKKVLARGAIFTAEVLQTGHVSFTCERGDETIASEISTNDKEVIPAIERLITVAAACV